jgi:hypothetical protein
MFLMLNIAILSNVATAEFEEKPVNVPPSFTIKGGVGIEIFIEDIDDTTLIGATVDGALLYDSNTYKYSDGIKLRLHTFKLSPFGTFNLYFFIDNYIFKFQCKSIFFIFVHGITPIYG